MRIIPLLIFTLFCVVTTDVQAQNCGCADEGNCPFSFNPNTTTQVCYEITDALNNNLANPTQGVCGVYVKFRHGRIGGMDLTLISPNGTPVLLVDATGSCNTWTPIATWDILFVPCSQTCEPDTINNCAYPCKFNACPPGCPWQNANYSGSYHPFVGCLENFNSGPANGQWCLEINNTAMFNGGAILDFEVILCDQSGLFCCKADAGNMAFEPDVNACEGDQSLLLDLDPVYGAVVPPPLEYGYTFPIFKNDTLLVYDSLADLRMFVPGTYKVCGLSFLWADTASMPLPGTLITPYALDTSLHGAAPLFCGDLDTNCVVVKIAAPPLPSDLNETICVGDTVYVGSSAYTTSGTYADTLASWAGCDSIVSLVLTVLPVDTNNITATICAGELYFLGNDTFTVTGMHKSVLQNFYGCDSLLMLDLTVIPPVSIMLTDTVCLGDTVFVGSNVYTTTGVYSDTLTAFSGCDSIITLDLTVVTVGVSIAPPATLTCQQTTISLNATASTSLGTLAYQWTTIGGSFAGSTTGPTAVVNDPGTYIVTVISTGCSRADTVMVLENAVYPNAVAFANQPDTLTCSVTSVQLDGSSSSGGVSLSYQWTGLGGSPVSNPNSAITSVASPDTYRLVVTNQANNCKDTAIVQVFQNITPPTANAGPDAVLSCEAGSFFLDGSASSGAGGVSYAWSTTNTGNIISSPNIPMPEINALGTYQLIVIDLVNACQDTDIVVVTVDTLKPVAIINIPAPGSLTCVNAVVTLDGSSSTGSPNKVFQWVGNIASGQNTPVATVTQPGNFSLILTDTINGCADTALVTVVQNTNPPQAEAGPGGSVSCTTQSVLLGGATSSMGPNFNYLWTSTPGGSFLSPTDTAFVTVDSAATYYLTVTDIQNGCTAMDSTVVADNYNPPFANAGPDGILNCQTTTYTLDGTASTIVPFTILQWKNAAAQVIGNTQQVTVNTPGTYTLTVSFAFCTDTDTVVVTADTLPPIANAGSDAKLDCNTGQTSLNGGASSTGPGFTYQWTTTTGTIVSGPTTLTPVVSKAAPYILTLTSAANHCTASDTALVTLDTAACMPLVNAGADGLINCYTMPPKDTLQTSGSVGPNISYNLTALTGTVHDASNPFVPVVSSGQFVFAVTNNAVGLTAKDTIVVVADTIKPVADLGPFNLELTCPELANCYQLDASNSSQGPNFAYLWEPFGGTLCSSPNVLNVEILGEGIYNLEVTNLSNGCKANDAVFVQLKGTAPSASAGADIQMLCGDTTTMLNGGGSSVGANISYEWYSPGGNIISGGNTTTPVVAPNNPQDVFNLVVLNNINLCRDTDDVVVFAPVNCFPSCQASVSGPLTCDTNQVTLIGTGSSSGATVSYLWAPLGGSGNLCGPANALNTCADAAGFYELRVTRVYPNGAEFYTTCQVQVVEDKQPPVAEAGPNKNLTCTNVTVTLNGNPSSTGANFTYSWSTMTGNIVSGAMTKTPVVNAVGTYDLLVKNTATGCTATDFVTVGLDTIHPAANAGPGDQLTCTNSNAVLNGSATPAGMNFLWSTPNGNICAGPNTPNPVVCAAGTYILKVTNPVNGCTDTDTTVVTQSSDFPMVTTPQNLNYTCTDTVFVIAATASGTGVLTYQWTALNGGCITGPTNILQPTVACPGTYRLTVTDLTNGCSAMSLVNVLKDNLPPVANAGSTQQINCSSFVITLDGSGSVSNAINGGALGYAWLTSGSGHFISGQTTAMPQVDSAGVYQLTVTDLQNQCTASASVTITIDADIPVAAAGPDTTLTCTRTSLKLKGTNSTSGPTITYNWTAAPGNITQGANTKTPTVNQPGVYVLKVEDTANNCVVRDSVLVTMDTIHPKALIDQTPQTVTCANKQVTLLGNISTPADSLTFSWTTSGGHILLGVNAANAVVDSAGTYILTVTHTRNGCTSTSSVFVNKDFKKPNVQLAPAPELNCDNLSVQLEVLPPTPGPVYTYAWSGPPVIMNSGTRTPTVSKTGLYTVVITDTGNGCSNQGSLIVGENFNPPTANANAAGTLDCENLSVQISGQGSSIGNVTYQWTTTSNGNILNPAVITTQTDAPGWYFLTVKRLDNGCSATDSTEVIATALPIDSALITLEQPDCENDEGLIRIDSILGGTPPFIFSLDSGIFITYPLFNYLDPGTYSLAIQDVNGCEWLTSITLVQPGDIFVELGDDHSIRQGQSVNLEALLNFPVSQIDTIIWTGLPDTVACPSCLAQTVAPLETTTYRVTVKDKNGCTATDQVIVRVNEERPFYVPTAFSPNNDGVNDRLLFFAGQDIVKVNNFRIFDRWGNMVFFAKDFLPNDPNTGWDGNLDGKPMDAAVFIWKAEVVSLDGTIEVFYGEVTLMR